MSSSADDSPNQNPVSQVTQANHDQQDSKVDTEKETSPPSVFVNLEPIREEQVQNAVKFLSHPKVRGSPVVYRRSFLERKGLTKEEIDEAFRRVPDSSPSVTATNSTTNQDGQAMSSLNVQQPQGQVLQSTAVGPLKTTSKGGTFYHFRWYHGVLAIGLLTISQVAAAVFFKRLVVPKLKSWIRWIVLEENEKSLVKKNGAKPGAAEEAAAAAKAAAMAAADVARASKEIVMTKSEEKRCLEELVSMLHVQASEMKSLSSAIYKLEGGHKVNGRIAIEEQENSRISRTSSGAFQQPYANGNGRADFDSQSVRPSLPSAPAEPSAAPHPKSYMEILAKIQRGERPSNIREIDDAPPNPNQPLPNPRLAPKPKPWEVSQPQSRSVTTFPTQVNSNGATYDYSNDYLNGDNTLPTWNRSNYKITEIESVDEQKFGLGNEQPAKKLWVPPQPPPVAMPEAAAAIRQPKKSSLQMEQQLTDEDDRQSANETNELQKMTEISEKGGSMEANGQNFEVPLNEIVPEEKALHLEA